MDQCSLQALPLPANEHVDFVAIDFETASGNPNSACSVGLAFVVGLEVVATTHRLIKPPGNKYEWGNVRVHGIRPRDTVNAPDFLTVWQELHPMLVGKALIAHNARFDMSVIKASLAAYGDSYVQQYADFKYVDSIATWPLAPSAWGSTWNTTTTPSAMPSPARRSPLPASRPTTA